MRVFRGNTRKSCDDDGDLDERRKRETPTFCYEQRMNICVNRENTEASIIGLTIS